ncbi:MAG: Gfo/Idh/MocA family oxidoreductase [Aldersonia sp.]|nr:Gfo/Idh/MocA family oxidoreductase [Aldersonia sp.]
MQIGLIGTGRIGRFHAQTLLGLDEVESLVATDVNRASAQQLADSNASITAADTVDDLLASGVDGVVITAATSAHAELIHRSLDARLPVFCEKPVALDVPSTIEVVDRVASGDVPVQIGFQRRFDTGYRAAKAAVESGELGWLHTLRAVTADQTPPPAEYIPTSGGLFRDCAIHDFDIMLWLTGKSIVEVYGWGANKGDDFFTAGGDVDTVAAVCKFEDDTLATVSATRYNGAGHDVRLEVCGSKGARVVGLDDRAALTTAERNLSWRQAPTPYQTFMERFHDAYVAELATFVDVAAGRVPSPCTVAEALQALYVAEACHTSRIEGRPVRVERALVTA